MGDALLAAIFGFTQLALVVMGVYVSLRTPKKKHHWYWIAAFVAVGVMGIWPTYTLEKRADVSQAKAIKEIQSVGTTAKQGLDQITGGEQFCYLAFGGWGRSGSNGETGIQLAVLNSGPLPLPRCYIYMYRQPTLEEVEQHPERSRGAGGWQALPLVDKDYGPVQPKSQSHLVTDTVLTEGVYFAKISTRNDEFFETIVIRPMPNPRGSARVPPTIDIVVFGKSHDGGFKRQLLKQP
jgi:hypothetical protein